MLLEPVWYNLPMKDWTEVQRKYGGQWVAFLDDEQTVVGSDSTLRGALEQAAENGHKDPIMARMPTEVMPYVGTL